MPRDREADHLEPVRPVRELPARLVRRVRGGNEQNPLERERLADFLGGAQVPDVDRIERAAEDADPHVRI